MDELIETGVLFCGTPDQVFQQIRKFYNAMGGMGNLLMMAQAGHLSHADTADNLSLFAREVYPRLQELKPPEQAHEAALAA